MRVISSINMPQQLTSDVQGRMLHMASVISARRQQSTSVATEAKQSTLSQGSAATGANDIREQLWQSLQGPADGKHLPWHPSFSE